MNTKLLRALLEAEDADVRRAVAVRMRDATGRSRRAAEMMVSLGYEPTDYTTWTDDGREVVRVAGQSWAVNKSTHASEIAAALEAERRQPRAADTKSVAGTESLSSIACPKCGDTLQHTSVCPSCAAGKLGYRHRYACVCGGVDLISKDKL
jgi:rubrerythrin